MKFNLIFLLVTFVIGFHAKADCPQAYLSLNSQFVNLQNDISPRIDFYVNRVYSFEGCSYKVGITKGSAPSYQRKLYNGSSTMNFQLAKNNSMSQVLKDQADWTTSSEYYEGRFRSNRGNSRKRFRMYAEAELSTNPARGYYYDWFYLNLYEEISSGSFVLRDSRPILFYYYEPDNIHLSLVESGDPFDQFDTSQLINFGNLYQGQTRGFDIVIQSTNGYNLKISSSNNGKMKHSSANQFVDYTLRVNGAPVNLSSSNNNPVNVSNGVGPHPSDGFRVPLNIEVGDTSQAAAGQYEDNLTITVSTYL